MRNNELTNKNLKEINGGSFLATIAGGVALVGGVGSGVYTIYKVGKGAVEGYKEQREKCEDEC